MLPVPMALAYQSGMPPACLPGEKRLIKNKKQGGNLSAACQKWREEKKRGKKGWIPQRVESWTNGSSHIPNSFEAWGFQRCLTALEDVPPNFNQHLIYLRPFENPAFHNPALAQSFLAVLKHTFSACRQQPCHKSHPSGAGNCLTCTPTIRHPLHWIPSLQISQQLESTNSVFSH